MAAHTLYATSVRTFARAAARDRSWATSIRSTSPTARRRWWRHPPARRSRSASPASPSIRTTGVLYGITSALSPQQPALARDASTPTPATRRSWGTSDLVGSDIAFDATGTLYVWLHGTRQLGMVDTSTAARSRRSASRARRARRPASRSTRTDMVYVTLEGASGTLDKVDTPRARCTLGPPLTGPRSRRGSTR